MEPRNDLVESPRPSQRPKGPPAIPKKKRRTVSEPQDFQRGIVRVQLFPDPQRLHG